MCAPPPKTGPTKEEITSAVKIQATLRMSKSQVKVNEMKLKSQLEMF